jgi:hypothetical protein
MAKKAAMPELHYMKVEQPDDDALNSAYDYIFKLVLEAQTANNSLLP